MAEVIADLVVNLQANASDVPDKFAAFEDQIAALVATDLSLIKNS